MEFNFVEEGEGFPLLLIHGFCNDLTLWDDVRSGLAEHFRVITIDLPGHGQSPMLEGEVTFQRVADELAAWLKERGIEKTIVIGHSMGGYVTLHLTDQHPDLVKAFGLFHSNANEDSQQRKEGRLKSIDIVQKQGMGVFIESFVPFLFFPKRVDELGDQIAKATQMAKGTSIDTHKAFTQAMHDRESKTHLLKIALPKIIIAGDNDAAVTFETSFKMMRQAKHATTHVMYDTGHMGMLERPQESIEVITKFAKEVIEG